MEKIKDTILRVIKDLSVKKGQENSEDIGVVLKKVLTKKELEHIKVNYFKNGVLGLRVDTSSWMYSLSLKKQIIIKDLDKNLGRPIRDIRFRIGEVK